MPILCHKWHITATSLPSIHDTLYSALGLQAGGFGKFVGLQGLCEHYRDLLAGQRDAPRLGQVLDFLLGHPIASVRQVQAGLGLGDYKTVLRYVEKLEQAGILHEVTGGKRNRLYRADEILLLLEYCCAAYSKSLNLLCSDCSKTMKFWFRYLRSTL